MNIVPTALSVVVLNYMDDTTPTTTTTGDNLPEDPFWGEYGTNHNIPNMRLWVRDVRTPWIVTALRTDFSSS